MKAKELDQLNFKDYLSICYEDIEPHLLKELDRLRSELKSIPDDPTQDFLLSKFEISVLNLNKIDQDESIESRIDTEEREGLCEALYKMGTIVGLDEETEYLDNWRDW